ncbi:MAG TPA: DUF416 family protein [Isosphaeraceae bacterium]|nr:DUF416 family protein [Isosphaeraceae bacterium]
MDQDLLQDINGFVKILGVFSRRWSPAQRTAFLAALAERWLGPYQRFTEAEGLGDPAILRQALNDAWAQAGGEPVDDVTIDRHRRILPTLIPSTDDFDAYDALTAGMLVALAVESLRRRRPGHAGYRCRGRGVHGGGGTRLGVSVRPPGRAGDVATARCPNRDPAPVAACTADCGCAGDQPVRRGGVTAEQSGLNFTDVIKLSRQTRGEFTFPSTAR